MSVPLISTRRILSNFYIASRRANFRWATSSRENSGMDFATAIPSVKLIPMYVPFLRAFLCFSIAIGVAFVVFVVGNKDYAFLRADVVGLPPPFQKQRCQRCQPARESCHSCAASVLGRAE